MQGGVNCIVMQSTGLEDKSGKTIWEGDILDIEDHINHIVGFKNGCFGWKNIRPFSPMIEKIKKYNCEIIGNIYENPDIAV